MTARANVPLSACRCLCAFCPHTTPLCPSAPVPRRCVLVLAHLWVPMGCRRVGPHGRYCANETDERKCVLRACLQRTGQFVRKQRIFSNCAGRLFTTTRLSACSVLISVGGILFCRVWYSLALARGLRRSGKSVRRLLCPSCLRAPIAVLRAPDTMYACQHSEDRKSRCKSRW